MNSLFIPGGSVKLTGPLFFASKPIGRDLNFGLDYRRMLA
jgi:hypothetical protein